MLNYLASTSRPGTLCSEHQAARLCSNLKQSHEEVVKRIGRCLKRNHDEGIMCRLCVIKPTEVCIDADFAGTWKLTESDLLTSYLSRSGHVIK